MMLAGIHDELHAAVALARDACQELVKLHAKVDRLEAEFGPLARKYGRLAAATDALPGQRWRRNAVQG